MMFNEEIYNNGGCPILIFGEMAGFKIDQFIATRVKMKEFFHGAMKIFFQPIRTRQYA